MFYVFVISQLIEVKLDSALEDISRSHNLYKKKKKWKNTHKYSVECLCICRVFHKVKYYGHPSSY